VQFIRAAKAEVRTRLTERLPNTDDRVAAGIGVGLVDLHNHVIPGVDDGAQDAAEARLALATLARDGVSALVATPHVELSLTGREALASRLDEIDAAWLVLESCAQGSGVVVQRGAEVRLGEADPDLSDPRLRLAGGRFVLVEFAFFTVPPRSERVLASIVRRGLLPIVAHPERYSGLDPGLEVVESWRAAGALLQVNGGSLLGRYGTAPARSAAALLARGWVDYLASDYHARGAPRIRETREYLEMHGGQEQSELLTRVNPARLLRDEKPLAVPALHTDSP